MPADKETDRRKYSREYRERNKDRINKLARGKKAKLARREYVEKNKEKINERDKAYRKRCAEKDPNYWKKRKPTKKKVNARNIARKIELLPFCEICNKKTTLERHHPDYENPKFFATFCKSCHTKIHKYLLVPSRLPST
ncbi:hypothetical protein LCGC14_0442290 [marine sediment metagenome]|uniref:Uncharacterized protein n=1 Tax=marine sediment metagenome TaxID=412755 RepID=A0A0F9SR53_9ZZZZ